MNVVVRVTVMGLTAASLAGCFGLAGLSYRGDGALTDHGMLAYSRRYVIDLGPFDVEHTGSKSYRLSGLPRSELVVGLDILEDHPNRLFEDRPRRGRLRILVKNSAGDVVIDENQPLEKWTRTYGAGADTSSYYRAGESVDVPVGNGDVRPTRIGLKSSGGWGTYFDADPAETYTVTVTVLEPLKPSGRSASVSVIGWDRV